MSEFRKSSAYKDGFGRSCKVCESEAGRRRYAENPDAARAARAAWCAANKEKMMAVAEKKKRERAEAGLFKLRRKSVAMGLPADLKHCFKCDTVMAIDLFSADATRADGRQPRCKACHNEYVTRPEYRAERNRLSRERRIPKRKPPQTRAEKTAKAARWWRENPDASAAIRARYEAKVAPERDRARREKAVLARREREDQAPVRRRLFLAHAAERAAARKAAKRLATPKWADRKKIRAFYELIPLVNEETGIKHHVDHIVPLKSKFVCGLHCEANLRVITATENIKKRNSWWPHMDGSR